MCLKIKVVGFSNFYHLGKCTFNKYFTRMLLYFHNKGHI